VALFDRTSRRVGLTPVGRRVREDLQQALDLLQAGLARAEAASLGAGHTLRLGVFGHAGHQLRPLVDAFLARHPGCDVRFGEINGSDPFTALRTGDHDVHVLWLPVAEPDLTVGPTVLTGGRVLAVSTNHPLADRGSVSLEDLADNHVVDLGPEAIEYWVSTMVPTRARPPHPPRARRTDLPRDPLPGHGRTRRPPARRNRRPLQQPPGIAFLPIHDAPTIQFALTWCSNNDSPVIRALAQTAADLGPISL
jgi:DNA-binding transcriptional LysR family regulator